MAGKPTLLRAKRYHAFHTSYQMTGAGSIKLKPTTSLILAPQGELKASPENRNFNMNASLIVQKNASINGNVAIGGNLSVTGSMIVTSSVLHKGDNIYGDSASDTQKFVGVITASGPITVNASLWAKTNASIDGTLDVGGNTVMRGTASLDGALRVGGNASLDGTLDVGGNAVGRGNASIDGTLDVGGNSHLRGNASVDGTLSVNGETDLNRNVLTGVSGGNVLHARKFTVATTDLTAASIDQRVYLFRASPGDIIYDVVGNVTAGFGYGALATIVKVSIGDQEDLRGLAKMNKCATHNEGWIFGAQTGLASPGRGDYLWDASAARIAKLYTLGTPIYAKFTASGGTAYLASYDRGAMDIYIDMMSHE